MAVCYSSSQIEKESGAVGNCPFRYQNVVILHPGTSMSVHEHFQMLLTPVITIFTDFLSAVLTSEIAQILSLYGGGFLSSEVAKLKWFCFALPLKLALYTHKKKSKKAVTIQCVLPTRPSEDGKCHWLVLEN